MTLRHKYTQSTADTSELQYRIQTEIAKFNGMANNQITRNQLKSKVNDILTNAILIGKISDFSTTCDSKNNSVNAIKQGLIYIDVVVKNINSSNFTYIGTEPAHRVNKLMQKNQSAQSNQSDIAFTTISYLKNKGWDKVTLNPPYSATAAIDTSGTLVPSLPETSLSIGTSLPETSLSIGTSISIEPCSSSNMTIMPPGIATQPSAIFFGGVSMPSIDEQLKSMYAVSKRIEDFLGEYEGNIKTPEKTQKDIISDNIKAFDDAMKLVD